MTLDGPPVQLIRCTRVRARKQVQQMHVLMLDCGHTMLFIRAGRQGLRLPWGECLSGAAQEHTFMRCSCNTFTGCCTACVGVPSAQGNVDLLAEFRQAAVRSRPPDVRCLLLALHLSDRGAVWPGGWLIVVPCAGSDHGRCPASIW